LAISLLLSRRCCADVTDYAITLIDFFFAITVFDIISYCHIDISLSVSFIFSILFAIFAMLMPMTLRRRR